MSQNGPRALATSMPLWQTRSLNRVPRIISVSRFQGRLDQQRAAAAAAVRLLACDRGLQAAAARVPPAAVAAATRARRPRRRFRFQPPFDFLTTRPTGWPAGRPAGTTIRRATTSPTPPPPGGSNGLARVAA